MKKNKGGMLLGGYSEKVKFEQNEISGEEWGVSPVFTQLTHMKIFV